MTTTQNYKMPSTSKVSVDKLLRVGCYDLEKTIGKGNFAVVKLASNIVTKTKVAIKIIDKTCLNEEYLAKTYREISILKTLRHRHITRLYEVMQSETMIYLVTEFASNGEIFDHLVDNGRMKEPEAARVFSQLVSALNYCHCRGVVHRDLKAENVLLDKDMNIKLADFGFSNRYEDGSPLTTWCGSPPYAAPEVFQGLEYDGPKADIWSLGVVLYALVCGALPFDGKTLLELKSRVVTGKFRIPYFMSQECEHLIRNMLVVEPERRYSIKQVMKHRWVSEWIAEAERGSCQTTNIASEASLENQPTAVPNLDSVVVSHMLQLSGLTADKIAQSVHENRFDNIYAIYYLLYDKLQQKRRETQRIQHHANRARSRTSITTGIVDRSEPLQADSIDRLSPLVNTNSAQTGAEYQWTDIYVELEKFSSDIELECLQGQNETNNQNQFYTNAVSNQGNGNGNTRRHTVGPGDVAHEQALQDPNVVALNFKYEPLKSQANAYPYPPINLPMLQNQPLHCLTIKDQHLLKPPLVMGATGSFNRRASDGGANLPYSFTTVQQSSSMENHNKANDAFGISPTATVNSELITASVNMRISSDNTKSNINQEEAPEEIQRYMQMRGKRHTVGCTEDLSIGHHSTEQAGNNTKPQISVGISNTQGVNTGMRTRRTGLLTVTERPPVISPELIREVETRMNRNYLPPALKMQNNYSAGFSLSPPNVASTSYSNPNNNSNYSVVGASPHGSTSAITLSSAAAANSAAASYNSRRFYGKSSKLPPVQEVGRYSPVRRASEGSKAQFQGPLQECQYLQKGIAQRNFLVAPSPPLLENSISLPGSPIHGKASGCSAIRRTTALTSSAVHDIEIPAEALTSVVPILDQLVKEQRISVELANKIISTRQVHMDMAMQLGLAAHGGHADSFGLHMQQQNSHSLSTSTNSANAQLGEILNENELVMATSSPLLQQKGASQFYHTPGINHGNIVGTLHSKSTLASSYAPQFQISMKNTGCHSGGSSGCQSPVYNSYSGSSSPNACLAGGAVFCGGSNGGGGSSPLHQITKGISYLTTGGGGSITRGTSAACEIAATIQPLDLSMDISTPEDPETPIGSLTCQNWFLPPSSYYDLKPLNLSPAQPVRVVTTPPTSPNLCIIQEENPPVQMTHTISTGTPYSGCTGGITPTPSLGILPPSEDLTSPGQQPSHPQICLTDVQGSEITLVAQSSETVLNPDSDCDSVEQHVIPLMSLQGLMITEPANDQPSITRGISGKNPSLETEPSFGSTAVPHTGSMECTDRRGSDKSLGFSDDSLSNDSNNLSPSQEPSASSGFKSDSHSEVGDHTEGHLTPDSMCESRRMSEEMYYELTLPYECSNLNPTRILEMVKQTIDSTMPPKGFVLHTADNSSSMPISSTSASNWTQSGLESSSLNSMDLSTPYNAANLSLEYSGGLQIEVQVCEGRTGSQSLSKGIKLRRISGDQFEYGKLCQQLINQLSMQQVAG
ncbi:uncharacterized protein LOC106092255 isoform X1 [Stomoxys calcitrans]|uniref:uncharacterized protein LOC106092255 isoform X1 n=1 Tax=Stomoxys calcitrans TaxID=35570 RepID=UPI0027E333B3|nr:uncharacterized protein LOC106092255 isoform X1 [Stomoxys calcitrans]